MWKNLIDASTRFRNRADAGRQLAERLQAYAGSEEVIVLGLPRGGVAVAAEIAAALHCPLDVFLVRKLGMPGYEELAMGAIAMGGTRVLNDDVIASLHIPPRVVEDVARSEAYELERRERVYRSGQPPLIVSGRTVIVVDDGLATGATMRAAVVALRQMQPSRLVVAVPVAAKESLAALEGIADEVVCLFTPEPFHAIGIWYVYFGQLEDDEVCRLLAASRQSHQTQM